MSSYELSVYSYFEKGCRKKCARQSCKVLRVVSSSLFCVLQTNLKEWQERPYTYICECKTKATYAIETRQLHCQEQGIDHIPYYLSGSSRCTFFRTTFLEEAVYIKFYICRRPCTKSALVLYSDNLPVQHN